MHIFRECNKAADYLAKKSSSSKTSFALNVCSLPADFFLLFTFLE